MGKVRKTNHSLRDRITERLCIFSQAISLHMKGWPDMNGDRVEDFFDKRDAIFFKHINELLMIIEEIVPETQKPLLGEDYSIAAGCETYTSKHESHYLKDGWNLCREEMMNRLGSNAKG